MYLYYLHNLLEYSSNLVDMLNKPKADMRNRKITWLTKSTWWTRKPTTTATTTKTQPFATIHNLSATSSPVKLVPSVASYLFFFVLIFYLSLPTKLYLIYYVGMYIYRQRFVSVFASWVGPIIFPANDLTCAHTELEGTAFIVFN